ncbi:hypothetical protein, partial [Pseudomonas syringae]
TLNQRRLEGAKEVRPLGLERVRGVVVKAGFHDEAGASAFVVLRDQSGVEHYARLRAGSPFLTAGRTVTLQPMSNGLAQVVSGRGADLSR